MTANAQAWPVADVPLVERMIPIIRLSGHDDKETRRPGQRQDLAWPDFVKMMTEHAILVDKDRGSGFAPVTMVDEPCACGKTKDGKAICPGKLGHFIRANVLAIHVLMLDLDKYRDGRQLDQAGAERAMERLDAINVRHIIVSSHSHRYPEHAALRAAIALTRPVTAEEWPIFYDAATRYLDIEHDAACSKTIGRFWYAPAHPPGAEPIAYAKDGRPLDVDLIMAIARAAEPAEPAPKPRPRPYAPTDGAFDIRDAMTRWLPGVRCETGGGKAIARWHVGPDGCPRAHDHGNKGAPSKSTVFLYPDGAWEFICQSTSHPKLDHDDFREHYEPGWIRFSRRPTTNGHRHSSRAPAGEAVYESADDRDYQNDYEPPPGPRATSPPTEAPQDDAPHAAATPRSARDVDTDVNRLTELGNARRLAARHSHRLRYVLPWRKWMAWDGKRWCRDELGVERRAAKEVADSLYVDVAELAARKAAGISAVSDDLLEAYTKFARASSKAAAIKAMLELAQSEEPIAAAPSEFDRDPFAFNVANGTLDLRTGRLRPHRQADMLTRLAPVEYDADATCPTWNRFLADVLPDADVRTFVQRFVGYCLTGDVSEQKLMFPYGLGANGKSVLLDVMLSLLGDYGCRAAPDLVLAKQGEAHPCDVAQLEGRRLAVCSEIEQGRAWAESTIKRITGDTTITARHMREDFYTFVATHKLVVAANTRPTVRGTDNGIWRRMRLVPFEVTITEEKQDKGLVKRLIADELPGILTWALTGCLAWQRDGLGEPAAIKTATDSYRNEQDILGLWIADECVVAPNMEASTAALHESFTSWCLRTARHPWTRETMRARLLERPGIAPTHKETWRGLSGIGLPTKREPPKDRRVQD